MWGNWYSFCPYPVLLNPKDKDKPAQTKIAPEGAIFLIPKEDFGGAIQSRTGLDGFAIRCITALLSRRLTCLPCYFDTKIVPLKIEGFDEKGKLLASLFADLERETRLELATSTLARLRSTN